ncbi:unnamed protein product [Cercopithifilaria johnstoni]|uniref:Uncharacterized protein n=1 Tax=Cercopithifilaria johnstoni TaxID=2874296 RepID=A0A8J2M0L3_9BILA|nr:unnamed protein product [Cercopithifilaria johnstoni]
MISNNGSFIGPSSYEQFDISQYRKFLNKLQNRASELWEAALCRVPTSNTIELLTEHMMIRESLLEIEMMQKTFAGSLEIDSTYSEQRKAALTDFVQWADSVGISHCFVEIAYDEDMDGFGLISSDYVTVGADLLRVPRKAIFSWDQARRSSFLK